MNKRPLQQPQPSGVVPGRFKIYDTLRETFPVVTLTTDSIFVVLAVRPENPAISDVPAPGSLAIIPVNTREHLDELKNDINTCIESLIMDNITSLQILVSDKNHPLLAEVKTELLAHKASLPKVARDMSKFGYVNVFTSGIDVEINFNEKRELIFKPFDAVQYRKSLIQQPAILNGSGSPFHRRSPHSTRMQQPVNPPEPPTVKS